MFRVTCLKQATTLAVAASCIALVSLGGADSVVDGVPAAVAALEDGFAANAVEVGRIVPQHRPGQVDGTAAGALRVDLGERPVAEDTEIKHDKLDRGVELRFDHRTHGVHDGPAFL